MLEGALNGGGVFFGEELAVAAEARGIVDEGDEFALGEATAWQGDAGTEEGVGLPGLVGMAFGEGQAPFVRGFFVGLEQIKLLDEAAEGVGSDLIAPQEAFFDTAAVDLGEVEARLPEEGF